MDFTFGFKGSTCELELVRPEFTGVGVLFTMLWHQLASKLEVEDLKLGPDA